MTTEPVAGCPGAQGNDGRYVVAPPVPLATPVPQTAVASPPVFTVREANLFRVIALSGVDSEFRPSDSGPNRVPNRATKWNRAIIAYIEGDQNYIDFARATLVEATTLAGLPLEITDDPVRANYIACVAMEGDDHRSNLTQWLNPSTTPRGLIQELAGFGQIDNPDDNKITGARVSAASSDVSYAEFTDGFIRSIITEEIVQSFGLIRDFDPSRFADLESARDSIFADELDEKTSMGELDKRMLVALYEVMPVNGTWTTAKEYLTIIE